MSRPGNDDLSSSSEAGETANKPRLGFDLEKLRHPDVACEWQHGRMVQNNTLSKAKMFSVTHPHQHFFRTDHA